MHQHQHKPPMADQAVKRSVEPDAETCKDSGADLDPGIGHRPFSKIGISAAATPVLQRHGGQEQEDPMTSEEFNAHKARLGQGESLPDSFRDIMEPILGVDLGQVVVQKSGLAKMIGAKAFMQGNEMHLPSDFDVNSDSGQQIMAHEAKHYEDQINGRVKPDPGRDLPINSDQGFERAADQAAADFQRQKSGT